MGRVKGCVQQGMSKHLETHDSRELLPPLGMEVRGDEECYQSPERAGTLEKGPWGRRVLAQQGARLGVSAPTLPPCCLCPSSARQQENSRDECARVSPAGHREEWRAQAGGGAGVRGWKTEQIANYLFAEHVLAG